MSSCSPDGSVSVLGRYSRPSAVVPKTDVQSVRPMKTASRAPAGIADRGIVRTIGSVGDIQPVAGRFDATPAAGVPAADGVWAPALAAPATVRQKQSVSARKAMTEQISFRTGEVAQNISR